MSAGSEERRQRPDVSALCERRPYPALSACLREAGHDGQCVFAKGSPGGRGRGASAVDFFRESPRGQTFSRVAHADYQGRPSRTDAAALWAIIEARETDG
jgi:hypothetical protein